MSVVSLEWSIFTRVRSTPSSLKMAICRRATWPVGKEWTMMGAPVSRCARATARAMVSRGGVTPSKSAAHLSMPALTPVPRNPSSMSRMNSRAI